MKKYLPERFDLSPPFDRTRVELLHRAPSCVNTEGVPVGWEALWTSVVDAAVIVVHSPVVLREAISPAM